jgi:hypothetical protein
MRPFAQDDACSADYAATTRVADGILEIAVYESRRPGVPSSPGCDTIASGRAIELDLAEPFTGGAWRDLYGPYLHFLVAPRGLAQLAGLPAGWDLREEGDEGGSWVGRWRRTYSPDASLADEAKTLRVFQSFGGPVYVTGGTVHDTVLVNGVGALLSRHPPTGELVLVWRLGDDELALVASEASFSLAEIVALAASAVRG